MKHTNRMMRMIARFLCGGYDAARFSFDFPAALSAAHDALHEENAALCDYLEEEMPELCGWYDPHATGDPGTLDGEAFRSRVMKVYQKALRLSGHWDDK